MYIMTYYSLQGNEIVAFPQFIVMSAIGEIGTSVGTVSESMTVEGSEISCELSFIYFN